MTETVRIGCWPDGPNDGTVADALTAASRPQPHTMHISNPPDYTSWLAMKQLFVLVTAVLIGALSGCGGSTAGFNVYTAGDSLADSGTFGFRFTVAGTAAAPNRVWPELVAASLVMTEPCARYKGDPATSIVEANQAALNCTGYAVGGARINPGGQANDSTPYSVLKQIRDLVGERRTLGERDLVLISGGANDAADLFALWLKAQDNTPASAANYLALLKELLTDAELVGEADPSRRAVLYMVKLANTLADTVRDQLLASGARRIVFANLPDLTRTPKLQAVLTPLQQPALYTFARELSVQFNEQFARRFATDSRVAIYSLLDALDAWVTDPPPEFTQVTTPACPATLTAPTPTYELSKCTATLLSSAEVAQGRPANWWDRYLFSDDFHPSPRGHAEAAAQVAQLLRSRGWN